MIQSVSISSLVKVYHYKSLTPARLADYVSLEVKPEITLIVCNSNARHRINCYKYMGFADIMKHGVDTDSPEYMASRLVKYLLDNGINHKIVSKRECSEIQSQLQKVINDSIDKAAGCVTPEPEPVVKKPEPVTTVTGGRVVREVAVRTGQSDFKHRVNMNFGGRCAISGHNTGELLQACHIQPFAVAQNNSTSNGILMDVGLHVLFDRDLMCINPDTMTVHFKSGLVHPYVALYEGVVINKSKVALNYEFLKVRWNMFK